MIRVLRIALPSALLGAWVYAAALMHALDKQRATQTRSQFVASLMHEAHDGHLTFYVPDSNRRQPS